MEKHKYFHKEIHIEFYSNPQSTLARLHFSDGSKRLLAEWWQIEMQKTALLVLAHLFAWKSEMKIIKQYFQPVFGAGPSQHSYY